MTPLFRLLEEKKLVGQRITTSFSKNRTYELWSKFMPRRKEIKNNLSSELISIEVYDKSVDFKAFNLETEFEKWATIEVADFDNIPINMESFTIPSGLYAIFIHKGPASKAPETFGYIFGTWLPNSEFELDTRPHFEVMGEKYENNSPDSEEEVWIPIRKKVIDSFESGLIT
jgi:AraC family transcriptional regulator